MQALHTWSQVLWFHVCSCPVVSRKHCFLSVIHHVQLLQPICLPHAFPFRVFLHVHVRALVCAWVWGPWVWGPEADVKTCLQSLFCLCYLWGMVCSSKPQMVRMVSLVNSCELWGSYLLHLWSLKLQASGSLLAKLSPSIYMGPTCQSSTSTTESTPQALTAKLISTKGWRRVERAELSKMTTGDICVLKCHRRVTD